MTNLKKRKTTMPPKPTITSGDLRVRHENGVIFIDVEMFNGDTLCMRMSPDKAVHVAAALQVAVGPIQTNDVLTVLRAIENFAVQHEHQFGKTSFAKGIRAAIEKGLDAFMRM